MQMSICLLLQNIVEAEHVQPYSFPFQLHTKVICLFTFPASATLPSLYFGVPVSLGEVHTVFGTAPGDYLEMMYAEHSPLLVRHLPTLRKERYIGFHYSQTA